MEVLNYMKIGSIATEAYEGPIMGHIKYHTDFIERDGRNSQNNYINEMFPVIYMEQVLYNLETYIGDSELLTLDASENIHGIYDIVLSGFVTNSDDTYKKYIAFEMVPIPPIYVLSYDGVRIDGFKDMSVSDRYALTRYEQYQEPIVLEESIEFGNPFEEPVNNGNPFEEEIIEEEIIEEP